MLRILHGTRYDFIRWWRWAAGLTVGFILLGLGTVLVTGGFRYSVEFTGGTLMQLEFTAPPDVARLRAELIAAGIHDPQIQQYGDRTSQTIRVQSDTSAAGAEAASRTVGEVLTRVAGRDGFRIERTEAVGPKVGRELQRGAVIAILISFGLTLLYLAWRFEWRFGVAAIIATAHDVLATIAFMKLIDLEISLTVIAGVLTVIGYSLNDTIIIFDRVRENLRKNRRDLLYDTLNRSVNETLPRSILTHGTTLAATLALLFFAGEVIRPFAWVMTFGIFTATFSSIYVASPILLWIEHKYPRAIEGRSSARPAARKVEPSAKPETA